MKKLLFDINSAVLRYGSNYLSGIGRTTLDLAKAISKKEKLPFEFQMFFQTIKGNISEISMLDTKKLFIPLPGNQKLKKITAQLRIKELLTNYDLLHIPHNFDTVIHHNKTLVTIHDAMFYSYPEAFLGHDFARIHYPGLAKHCRAIVTCSESSKSDIVKYMNISPDKITVIPWGVSREIFYPEDKQITLEVLNELQVTRPYFLMVSCDIGRKNTISLLRAYKLFLQQHPEHDLNLVWHNPPKVILDEFAKEIQAKRVRFLSNIDNNTLRSLYCGATVSFFPSKYEGFGLPILESMACGTPVVTCQNSSLAEVGGEIALYTSPDNLDELIDYMKSFESTALDLNKMKKDSLKHIEKFTWENCADRYIDFYEKNLNE